MEINALLDRLPRLTFDLGSRRLPTFRSLGILGFFVSVVVAALTAVLTEVSLLFTSGLIASAATSFLGWLMLRKRITGAERIVQIENVWVALVAVLTFAWAAGGPVVPALDILAVGLFPFLAFGRVGCLVAGCCHGTPAGIGVVYGTLYGLAPRLTGRRLFPVQLVESVTFAFLGVIALAIVGLGPGVATVWFLATHAMVRFGTDSLRGDVRTHVLGVSGTRWIALGQLAVALALAEWWLTPGGTPRQIVVPVVVLTVAVVLGGWLTRSRGQSPLARAEHLDEVWRRTMAMVAIAGTTTPLVEDTSLGMTIGVTGGDGGFHVSLSHPRYPVDAVAGAFDAGDTLEANGITHLWVASERCSNGVGELSESLAAGFEPPLAVAQPPADRQSNTYFGAGIGSHDTQEPNSPDRDNQW